MPATRKIILSILLTALAISTANAQYTPESIYTAARSGRLGVIKKKLPKKPPQELLNNLLGAAVAGNQKKTIDFLIKKGADVDHKSSWDNPVLMNAIMFDREEAAIQLLSAGADINIIGFNANQYGFMVHWNWTPLMAAAYKGHAKTIDILLQKGAEINETGWSSEHDDLETAADIAAYSGHLSLAKSLLNRNGKIGPETIFKAVRGGHLEVVKFLLGTGVDINALGERNGRTLLMEAAWWGKIDIAQYLVEHGADVNVLSKEGYTALGEAIRNAESSHFQYDIAKYLIQKGADVNLSAPYHMTPLMSASWYNNTALINLLLEHGAK